MLRLHVSNKHYAGFAFSYYTGARAVLPITILMFFFGHKIVLFTNRRVLRPITIYLSECGISYKGTNWHLTFDYVIMTRACIFLIMLWQSNDYLRLNTYTRKVIAFGVVRNIATTTNYNILINNTTMEEMGIGVKFLPIHHLKKT